MKSRKFRPPWCYIFLTTAHVFITRWQNCLTNWALDLICVYPMIANCVILTHTGDGDSIRIVQPFHHSVSFCSVASLFKENLIKSCVLGAAVLGTLRSYLFINRWFSIRPCIQVWKKMKFRSPHFLLIYTFSCTIGYEHIKSNAVWT